MTESLHRVGVGFLVAFALVALALGYWSVARGPELLAREDNPRLVLAEQQIRRGAILARDGTVLATGLAGGRQYSEPAFAPVVGYYSIRYGGDGIEAAYDDTLRGDAFLTPVELTLNRLLHREQVGGDVRLTIDPAVQRAAMQALDGQAGAIVVVSAPGGDVLALASSPSYDPNQIDADWDALVADSSAPLLNRATQGLYQPGAAFQVILLSAAYNVQSTAVSAPWSGDLSVSVEGARLPCAGDPDEIAQLTDAFVWGCPAPFVALAEAIGTHRLEETVTDFGLLGGGDFDLPTQYTEGPITFNAANLNDIAIGQGDLLVTPLQMARITAALANNGVVPPLRLVEAVRPPSDEWRAVPVEGHERAIISPDSAEAMTNAMTECVAWGAAQAAALPHERVRGHVGLAVAGPEGSLNAWFTGYTGNAAVVVLLEGESSAERAAQIGGQILAEVVN
jgi:peptidoglycan glycosyltransferase